MATIPTDKYAAGTSWEPIAVSKDITWRPTVQRMRVWRDPDRGGKLYIWTRLDKDGSGDNPERFISAYTWVDWVKARQSRLGKQKAFVAGAKIAAVAGGLWAIGAVANTTRKDTDNRLPSETAMGAAAINERTNVTEGQQRTARTENFFGKLATIGTTTAAMADKAEATTAMWFGGGPGRTPRQAAAGFQVRTWMVGGAIIGALYLIFK